MGEHDRLFKRAFRLPKHAAGELEAVLPRRLLDIVDLGSLELVENDDLVDHWLGERFRDALFQANFRGVRGFIWFLVEHQSEPDRFMVLRVLEYMARSWIELLRFEPRRKTLPPVVGVIVHHGDQGWTAPRRLAELIESAEQIPELRGLVPDFEIIVDDLVLEPDEDLRGRDLQPFPKVVLWVLRDARKIQRFFDHLVGWAEELSRLARESPEDFATVARYILTVAGDESFETIHDRIVQIVPAAETPMATAAQQLMKQGEIVGEVKGRAEGEARGRAEEAARAVLVVLEARGLAVSAAERERIVGCPDVATLEGWVRRAVTVAKTEELFC